MLGTREEARSGPQNGARLIVASNHQRNDRQRNGNRGGAADPGPAHAAGAGHRRRLEDARAEWLWGWHTVLAALANPARPTAKRLLATADRAQAVQARFGGRFTVEVAETAAISQILPPGAVHQGVGLRIPPLDPVDLDDLGAEPRGILIMLDQVTDPQNIGAIFRSAAAFGARGMILQDRHAPLLTGALAKAAAGAIDQIPQAREVNLSRALERLETLGWRAVALDGDAPDALADVLDGSATVLVLGAEGEGVRRLVREHCDALANIPMPGGFESLNVSAAAAVALYEASRPR
jgi:23S rRNA (guanosine2251-2'-O)-methyltransferase